MGMRFDVWHHTDGPSTGEGLLRLGSLIMQMRKEIKTMVDKLLVEVEQTRQEFEGLKGVVVGKLDELLGAIAALSKQIADGDIGAAEIAAAELDGIQVEMAALREAVAKAGTAPPPEPEPTV